MPSSRYLARDVVRLVKDQLEKTDRDPLKVLELGPGTGIFTERIMPHLKEGDRFDVVELNEYFHKVLKRRFHSNGVFRLHHKDFLAFESEYKYDFIISSLPYEGIPSQVTRLMWEHKLYLSKSGTQIIYYKYVNFNKFRSRFEKKVFRNYCQDQKFVFLNMPPARLITLQIDDPQKCMNTFRKDLPVTVANGNNGNAGLFKD